MSKRIHERGVKIAGVRRARSGPDYGSIDVRERLERQEKRQKNMLNSIYTYKYITYIYGSRFQTLYII